MFAIRTVPGFLPFVRAPSPPSSSSSSLFFDKTPLLGGMKFAFKIKTEPVTQATIIIGVVAFSSRLLAGISFYLGATAAGIVCAIVLGINVRLTLRLSPR